MWSVNIFRKQTAEAPIEYMTQLGSIVHMLARRNPDDEGFMINTQCMSTSEFEYVTRERVEPAEKLQLKIVSGPHVLDVWGIVQTVSQNNIDPFGPAPRMTFYGLSEHDRRVLQTMIERQRAGIA